MSSCSEAQSDDDLVAMAEARESKANDKKENKKKDKKDKKDKKKKSRERDDESHDPNGNAGDDHDDDANDDDGEPRKRVVAPLSAKELRAYNKKQEQKGIIYLPRIPPYMKPSAVRNLLEQYGTIERLFLKPESELRRTRRIKTGGNRRVFYEQGWVEFSDKRVAKKLALSLDNTPITNRKRSRWADDTWSLKYLSKVKWDDLVERHTMDKAVRERKLKVEVAASKREVEHFLEAVEKGKAVERMVMRRGVKKDARGFVHGQRPVAEEGDGPALPEGLGGALLGKRKRDED